MFGVGPAHVGSRRRATTSHRDAGRRHTDCSPNENAQPEELCLAKRSAANLEVDGARRKYCRCRSQVEAEPLADDTMKLVLALAASLGAMELSADNFKTEVFESGKNAFVKFLAPW